MTALGRLPIAEGSECGIGQWMRLWETRIMLGTRGDRPLDATEVWVCLYLYMNVDGCEYVCYCSAIQNRTRKSLRPAPLSRDRTASSIPGDVYQGLDGETQGWICRSGCNGVRGDQAKENEA